MSKDENIGSGNQAAQSAANVHVLGGLRDDAGKTRFDLIPFDALLSVAKVYTQGAEKYAPRNWEKGMLWSRCLGSLMRHLVAWETGEDNDPESKLPHMAHVAWNAIALLTYHIRGTGSDDRPSRPQPESRRETIDRLLKEEFDVPAFGIAGIDRDSLKHWCSKMGILKTSEDIDKRWKTIRHEGTGAEAGRIEEKIALNNANAARVEKADLDHHMRTHHSSRSEGAYKEIKIGSIINLNNLAGQEWEVLADLGLGKFTVKDVASNLEQMIHIRAITDVVK